MRGFQHDMDSRPSSGSASSASGYSLRSRGSSAKNSPFGQHSSSKLSQSIIRDHMIAHYKRVYSAKAAVDTSVPKSLLYSVKYNDQLKRGFKKGLRPQSAHFLSERSRASCSPAQSHLSLQYDDSPYLFPSRSMTSTPRPNTSFHPKSTAYAPFPADFPRLGALDYRSFQDPAQKTYSRDLLQTHAQCFTPEKPFTPRTLKNDKSAYLTKYRYYRAPHSRSQDYRDPNSGSQDNSQKEKQRRRNMESTGDERSQGCSSDHDTSEKDFHISHSTELRKHSMHRSREQDTSRLFPRVSYEGQKSPSSRSLHTEEEELKYLEFMAAVTDDILSRGFISDSVIDRVINRHADMNRYHLNEGKMRHLLEVLRQDLKEPSNSPINTLNFERGNHLQLKNPSQRDHFKETGKNSASTVSKPHSLEDPDPTPTPALDPEPDRTFLVDPVEINEEKGDLSRRPSERGSFSETDIEGRQSDDEKRTKESEELAKTLQEVGTALETLNASQQPSERSRFSETDSEGRQSHDEKRTKESEELAKTLQEVGTALETLNVSQQSLEENEETEHEDESEDEF